MVCGHIPGGRSMVVCRTGVQCCLQRRGCVRLRAWRLCLRNGPTPIAVSSFYQFCRAPVRAALRSPSWQRIGACLSSKHAGNRQNGVVRSRGQRNGRRDGSVRYGVQHGLEHKEIARRQTDAPAHGHAIHGFSFQPLGKSTEPGRVCGDIEVLRVVPSGAEVIKSAGDSATDDVCIQSWRQCRIGKVHSLRVNPHQKHSRHASLSTSPEYHLANPTGTVSLALGKVLNNSMPLASIVSVKVVCRTGRRPGCHRDRLGSDLKL